MAKIKRADLEEEIAYETRQVRAWFCVDPYSGIAFRHLSMHRERRGGKPGKRNKAWYRELAVTRERIARIRVLRLALRGLEVCE